MPFEKGRSGNPAGRPRGAVAKVPSFVKTMIEEMVEGNMDSIKAEFKALKGREKVKAFIDLLPYLVPRLQSTDLAVDHDLYVTKMENPGIKKLPDSDADVIDIKPISVAAKRAPRKARKA